MTDASNCPQMTIRQEVRAQFQRQAAGRAFQLLAFLALLAGASCSRKNEGVAARRENIIPVDVQSVATVEVDRTLPIVGTLFAKDEATIGAEVEGRVERTLVEFGDRVKEGQEIARIDTTSYEAYARQPSANVDKSTAMAANFDKDAKRIESLVSEKIS